MKTLAGRRANGERGAVLVITAVLVMFVAIGLLALTIDIGNITYNRAQLQNGADASSLALAAACAQRSVSDPQCAVTDSITGIAVKNGNADQLMSIVESGTATCIHPASSAIAPNLPQCPAPAAADAASLSKCQPLPASVPASASYVQVTTQTKMKDGTTVLPFLFAKGGGSTHRTCSRAAWGPAGSTGLTFPLAMGMCDWNKVSSSGYAPPPPYTPSPSLSNPKPAVPAAALPHAIGIFAHATDNNLCSPQPNGGFSFLSPGPSCVVTIADGDWVQSDTGASVPKNGCPAIFKNYLGTIVTVPVFDKSTGVGAGAKYHIAGIASFYLAGWDNLPGGVDPNKTTTVYKEPTSVCSGKCNGSTTYVWGWFTTALRPVDHSTIDPNGNDLGARVVVPAG